jgi:cysteine-rich repeat protein
MIAKLNLAMSETATVNSNSQLTTMRFRLVGVAGPYNFPSETDSLVVLKMITNTSTSIGADLLTKRTAVGADTVAMISTGTDVCGIAYRMSSLGDYFKSNAYSVTVYTCLTGDVTFAHELGHNLGLTHNKGDGGSQGVYSYGDGWRWNGDSYRSVMSYAPGTQMPYWSNPSVTNNGGATGDAADGDSVTALKNVKGTAAGWYPAAMCSGLSQAYCTDTKNPNCKWTGSACTCISSTGCITEMMSWDMLGCGNGVVQAGEECDDGNASNTDKCSTTCKLITSGSTTPAAAPTSTPTSTGSSATSADGLC